MEMEIGVDPKNQGEELSTKTLAPKKVKPKSQGKETNTKHPVIENMVKSAAPHQEKTLVKEVKHVAPDTQNSQKLSPAEVTAKDDQTTSSEEEQPLDSFMVYVVDDIFNFQLRQNLPVNLQKCFLKRNKMLLQLQNSWKTTSMASTAKSSVIIWSKQ